MTLEERVKLLEDLVNKMVKTDRYIFERQIQIFDGRSIIAGTNQGLTIGTVGGSSGQKLGFFGATPVVQQTLPSTPTATQIRIALENLGFSHQ